MTRRGVVWGAGVGVALSALTAALINELHGGWPWVVASVLAVAASAALTMWMVSANGPPSGGPVRVEAGAVWAGRDIEATVRTEGAASAQPDTVSGAWRVIGPGAVAAERDIHGTVDTDGRRPSTAHRRREDRAAPARNPSEPQP